MVLLTGYSGFLGKQILSNLGDVVFTLGRNTNADIVCDLSEQIPQIDVNVSLVIHAAGLAHIVPKTDEEKKAFYNVNVKGTQYLLEGLRRSGTKPKQFLFISSIAVYGERLGEYPYPQKEEAEILELSAYGWSKWDAENVVRDWCEKEGVIALIWRLPLIVGENAPGNLGAMEKAIKRGYYFRIGDSYQRFRYYVDVQELCDRVLALDGSESGTFNIITGQKSYGQFEDELAQKYNKKIKSLPLWVVKYAAKVGDFIPGFPLNTYRLKKLEISLTFTNTAASKEV
jgi:nucleoside-diphosphate-sugar epimerase